MKKISIIKNHRHFNKATAGAAVILVAAIGTVLLFRSHAATPFASVEPENGTLSRPDLAITDTTASGGRAVRFGAAPTGQLNCASQPSRCGFADETNTGILAGVTLTKVPSEATSGPGWTYVASPNKQITITGNIGTATTGFELADGVEAVVTASNVTVRNVKLLGIHGQDAVGIKVKATTDNVKIEYCDVTGAPDSAGPDSPLRGWAAVLIENGANNYSVNYCHVRGFSGPFFPQQQKGINTFIGNYAHRITCWDYWNNLSCAQSNAQFGSQYHDHCNTWGNGGGPESSDTTSRQIIKDNTFYMDHPNCGTSALSLFGDGNVQTSIKTIIEHNLLSSTSYYCVDNTGRGSASPSGGITYLAFKNNHWSTKNNPACGFNGALYKFPNDASSGTGNYQCGNVWDDGALAGSGADQESYYPASMKPVTTCPSPAPW